MPSSEDEDPESRSSTVSDLPPSFFSRKLKSVVVAVSSLCVTYKTSFSEISCKILLFVQLLQTQFFWKWKFNFYISYKRYPKVVPNFSFKKPTLPTIIARRRFKTARSAFAWRPWNYQYKMCCNMNNIGSSIIIIYSTLTHKMIT